MLVLGNDNNYGFANTVIKLTDNTVVTDDTTTPTPDTPEFNFLIPTYQKVGVTNKLELFYPNEPNRYLNSHGTPNALNFGFGPDLILSILKKGASDVGVYTINLRGASATMANIIVAMKYKVEVNVAYTNSSGEPYYVTPAGVLTTDATGNTAVVRDVLHTKFVTSHIDTCKKWTDVYAAMNALTSTTPDTDGYKTLPAFSVMYRGATEFGDNVYFNMVPSLAQYDGNMYYTVNLYDGINNISTSAGYSADVNSGVKYDTSYFMETMFNNQFQNLMFSTSDAYSDLMTLIGKYLYTVEDFTKGTMASPSKSFSQIDMFNMNLFGAVTDAGSLSTTTTKAFSLLGGTDGTETAAELFKSFFDGTIVTDIASPLRYKFNYVPDIGYDDDTKKSIVSFITNRTRMTTATVMIGNTDTFSSALVEHQASYYDNMPNIRQIPKIQSPMQYNDYTRRTMTFPAGYYDTLAMVDNFIKFGNFYQPFAGADARWTGFIEDTMVYPDPTVDFVNSLQINRINCVMKDYSDGAYLNDQLMNTLLTSDQTEFNNALLISNMLYDLVKLIHQNSFKFNEAEDVRSFQEAVSDVINTKYAPHSASMSVSVSRLGTTGRSKSTNKITVTIDMFDINRSTDVNLVLVDE